MMGSRFFTYIGFFVLLVAVPCLATTWTVDDDGPADFASIQEAINTAWHGDTIVVHPGIYVESIYFNSLAITVKSTKPNDPNVVKDTIIEATAQYTVTFDFLEGPDSVLTGFSITGGGIHCLTTSPTITYNIIRDCPTRGVEGSFNAAPTIEYNIIRNNQGGINTCHGPIRYNTITENSGVQNGGGLYNCDGQISNNMITKNISSYYGGGLSGCGGEISYNDVTDNKAQSNWDARGGGLYLCSGTIIGNTIRGNKAHGYHDSYGGALYHCGSLITNNNISNNTVESTDHSAFGGGLYDCNGEISDNTIADNVSKGNSDAYGGGCNNCDGAIIGNFVTGNLAECTNGWARGGGFYSCSGDIMGNIITDNRSSSTNGSGYGGGLYSCSANITNNIIGGNIAKNVGGGLSVCSNPIINNTIIGNRAGDNGGGLNSCPSTIKNNIIAFNEANIGGGISGGCSNSYNCFWSNLGGNFASGAYAKTGDIHHYPHFAQDGYWDDNGTPGDSNDDTWIEGEYYLKSEAGRWDPNMQVWIMDEVSSPCIDAGDPADDIGDETAPHGDRINMGAYGGTIEASKTAGTGITAPGIPLNFTVKGGPEQLTVQWDDPNYDGGLPIEQFKIYRGPSELSPTFLGQVAGNVHEYVDSEVVNGQIYYYSISAVNGFGEGEQCSSVHAKAEWHILDINGDGVIDMADFALFCQNWLWQAWWYEP